MDRHDNTSIRLIGAGVAFGIAVTIAVLIWIVTTWAIGVVGVAVATMLGWLLGPCLRPDRDQVIAATLLTSAGCTVLGALCVGLIGTGDAVDGAAIAALGIAVYGFPAFVILNFPALGWMLATRYLVEADIPCAGLSAMT